MSQESRGPRGIRRFPLVLAAVSPVGACYRSTVPTDAPTESTPFDSRTPSGPDTPSRVSKGALLLWLTGLIAILAATIMLAAGKTGAEARPTWSPGPNWTVVNADIHLGHMTYEDEQFGSYHVDVGGIRCRREDKTILLVFEHLPAALGDIKAGTQLEIMKTQLTPENFSEFWDGYQLQRVRVRLVSE